MSVMTYMTGPVDQVWGGPENWAGSQYSPPSDGLAFGPLPVNPGCWVNDLVYRYPPRPRRPFTPAPPNETTTRGQSFPIQKHRGRHRWNLCRVLAFRLYRWLGCPRLEIGGL